MYEEITNNEIEEVLIKALRAHLELNKNRCIDLKTVLNAIDLTELDRNDPEIQRRFLTGIYDLFRKGYLAWGEDFGKPFYPYCHITHRV